MIQPHRDSSDGDLIHICWQTFDVAEIFISSSDAHPPHSWPTSHHHVHPGRQCLHLSRIHVACFSCYCHVGFHSLSSPPQPLSQLRSHHQRRSPRIVHRTAMLCFPPSGCRHLPGLRLESKHARVAHSARTTTYGRPKLSVCRRSLEGDCTGVAPWARSTAYG
jgi:hypothetical protein